MDIIKRFHGQDAVEFYETWRMWFVEYEFVAIFAMCYDYDC